MSNSSDISRFRPWVLTASQILWVVSALIVLIILSPPRALAAEFHISERNPILDKCLFSNSDNWMGDFHPFQEYDCLPNSPEASPTGTGTPDALKEVAGEGGLGIWFWNGGPRLMADGGGSIHENLYGAAFFSARLGRVIEISGQIEKGDAETLAKLLSDNNLSNCYEEGYCPFNNVISLNSPGGSLSESLKIAQIVRDNQFATYLGVDSVCASACSLVYFAGFSQYEDLFFPRRFAHATAKLGVHRPSVDLPQNLHTTENVYKLLEIFDSVKAETIHRFLSARVSMPILEKMYATPPDSMYYLSVPQLKSLGTVFLEEPREDLPPDRAGILSLCAGEFEAKHNRMPIGLLENLQLRKNSFITYSAHDDFACFGAQSNNEPWKYEICWDEFCSILTDGCQDLHPIDGLTCTDADKSLAAYLYEEVHHGSIGTALAGLSSRQRHLFARNALAPPQDQKNLPVWVSRASVPDRYCGHGDFRAAETTKLLQTILNNNGFSAGSVDGMIGAATFQAVKAANQSLLNVNSELPSLALMQKLGANEAQIRRMTLCSS